MRLAVPFLLLLSLSLANAGAGADAAGGPAFAPHRVSLHDLLATSADADVGLAAALRDVGLVAVRDVPGYAAGRASALAALAACVRASSSSSSAAAAPVVHAFADGTVRTTFATRTVPGPGGAQPLLPPSDAGAVAPPACRDLAAAGDRLRAAVDGATRAFAARVAALLEGGASSSPLLETPGGRHAFDTFADAAAGGEHLEHFHAYARPEGQEEEEERTTLDWHTDQGLFIAFTPALSSSEGAEDGFYVALADGTRVPVAFHPDDLVFMVRVVLRASASCPVPSKLRQV